MIVVVHQNNKVVAIERGDVNVEIIFETNIARQLFLLAKRFPDEWLIWCDTGCKDQLDRESLPDVLHHKRMMHSYWEAGFLGPDIGFVENSPFIKVNSDVQYPTWQMSTSVGCIHGSVLLAVASDMVLDIDFDYFLNSLAKLLMPLGVFCYHNPGLLKKPPTYPRRRASTQTLFRFVKQHYKTRWVFLLFLNIWYHKKRFPVGPLLLSLFYTRRSQESKLLGLVPLQSSKPFPVAVSVDVVIPTIGRTEYVKAVINDLAKQTRVPNKMIIVEQNPDAGSVSALETEVNKTWPFEIKHIFTHKTGACYARNLGLKEVTADWVFLADDDNVLEPDLIQRIFTKIKTLGVDAVTTCYLQKNEKQVHHHTIQWQTFGAGNSFVRKSVLKDIQFDESLEHGYGEDADFGMQLRNKGVDIIYVPEPSIVHLKAPMGGFRTKPVLPWHQEPMAPKPAPTIMRFHLKHRTQEQILGYKTSLFVKYYRKQSIKNPFRYFSAFKKQWNQSLFWAEKLAKQNIDN